MRPVRTILFIFLLVVIALFSCHEKKRVADLSIESLSDLQTEEYKIKANTIRENLQQLALSDTNTFSSDIYIKKYYLNNNPYLWITRNGVFSKADSVLKYIYEVEAIGLNPDGFCCSQIDEDLQHLRSLDFKGKKNNINRVLARLEYNLTKAYVLYCVGMRFGFINPYRVLNHIDIDDSDTINVAYRQLFDIPMQHAGPDFYAEAINMIRNDSTVFFMRESYPENKLYNAYAKYYRKVLSPTEKKKVLINMERCRWKFDDYPDRYKKYVLVNLPSLILDAIDGQSVLSMRIGCGARSTKTPLLTSKIKRLDFNPQWVIPRSIIKKDISRHVGDVDYFERNNYFVLDKKTGEIIDVSSVTHDMINSSDIMVVQHGGAGNSLGSVIFRFDNNFSVYMHDTSTRSVFSRSDRCVSHGCIRVEKPFELAVFMISEKDNKLIDRIKYSMELYSNKDAFTENAENEINSMGPDKKRYLRSLKIEPAVPVFITYYTIYPDKNGVMREYKDIYGFDSAIYSSLGRFV